MDSLASESIARALGLDEEVKALLRPTQDPKFGDYQVNGAMPLAKRLKKNPRELAAPIAEALLEHEAVAKAEVAGPGFVNIFLEPAWMAARLEDTLRDTARDGVPEVQHDESIVVDFSGPNIAKQMHVGHLRSTIIGDAIVRLLRFLGHRVIGDNHLGDWGTQFGLLIVGMREWGSEEALKADPIVELERVYKLASAKKGEDEDFAQRARDELAKLQSGDEANLALWKRFVDVTRQTLDAVYALLDVSFDEWLGESAYNDALPGVVTALIEKKLAREDQGAIGIFWKEMPKAELPKMLKKQEAPYLVRKKDGAFMYATTDIATVLHRREHFHADRSVYVVGAPQRLHFEQLFTVMKMLDVEMRLDFVSFGSVLGGDGKVMRTRDASGKAITLMSLLEAAQARAKAHIEQGRSEGRLSVAEEDVDDVARVVGIGAVKYADLHQNRTSDYKFDLEKMVSFEGDAGPYLQYNYARVRSIFRKGEVDISSIESFAAVRLEEPSEVALGRHLLRFSDVVYSTAESYEPHRLCEHLYELARAFSRFYRDCPVLKSEGATRESRLALAALASRQLKRGLGLLGIKVVERM